MDKSIDTLEKSTGKAVSKIAELRAEIRGYHSTLQDKTVAVAIFKGKILNLKRHIDKQQGIIADLLEALKEAVKMLNGLWREKQDIYDRSVKKPKSIRKLESIITKAEKP